MEVPGSASGVFIFECIASEASTANPLKKRAFRRPMDQVDIFMIVSRAYDGHKICFESWLTI